MAEIAQGAGIAKEVADAWPIIKDALTFLRDYWGLPGVLFFITTCWFLCIPPPRAALFEVECLSSLPSR